MLRYKRKNNTEKFYFFLFYVAYIHFHSLILTWASEFARSPTPKVQALWLNDSFAFFVDFQVLGALIEFRLIVVCLQFGVYRGVSSINGSRGRLAGRGGHPPKFSSWTIYMDMWSWCIIFFFKYVILVILELKINRVCPPIYKD